MATITTTQPAAETQGDQLVALDGVDWAGYAAMLRIRGEHSLPRMTYLDGRLALMSPSYTHERLKKLLGSLVEIVFEGLGVRFVAGGSTTLRRKRKRGGVEGGEIYFLKDLEGLRGKKQIDLRVDSPPDLAVDVVVTHEADDAIEVYRRLGVPEVWICTQTSVTFLTLGAEEDYATTETSLAVPCLTIPDVQSWIAQEDLADDYEWRQALRRWVVDDLAERPRGPAT